MKVILFDGVCNLCNASVNKIIALDRKNIFHFASLQSNYGIELMAKNHVNGELLLTVYYWDGNKLYARSDAVLKIMSELGGVWSVFIIFKLIPAFIRNFIYQFIADHRYAWFGKRDTCMIPTPELKARFLN